MTGATPSARYGTVITTTPADIPTAAGCYQFYESDRCLYVGKASNLRQRLSQYLAAGGSRDARIAAMVARADRLEWIVLESETDALLTEAQLIGQLEPEYNIRLREDHPYPAVAIDNRDGVARLTTWRGAAVPGVEVFGPYPGSAARHVVDALLHVAPIRSCDAAKFSTHQRLGRPCMLADIGRCPGPCVSSGAQDTHVEQARSVLRGRRGAIETQTRDAMDAAAERRQYEVAARLRDQLRALEVIAGAHLLDDAAGRDLDIIGVAFDAAGGAGVCLSIRNGAVVRTAHHIVDAGVVSHTALVEALAASVPTGAAGRLLLHDAPLSPQVTAPWRTVRRARTAGERRLVDLAGRNANETLRRARLRRASNLDARRAEIARLQALLGLRAAPLRIEAVDISHLGGAATVSVVAVLQDGLPLRKAYRRYRLTDHGGDDYAAMREVLTRRLADSIDGKAPFMDLLLIDGGPSQLAVAVAVLAELGLTDRVEVASLAKRLELVHRPGVDEPITLDRGDAALLLLQRARDETHRASNTFQRKVASKRLRGDYLEHVAGLGARRKAVLLDAVGGWRGMADLDRATLDAVSGLPHAVRDAVWERLQQQRGCGLEDTTQSP